MLKKLAAGLCLIVIVSLIIHVNLALHTFYTPNPQVVVEEPPAFEEEEEEIAEIEPEPCLCPAPHEEAMAFIEQFGGDFAIHFENLEAGFVFSHYGDRVFFGASSTKAHFAFYIYYKASTGRTNLNNTIYFAEGDYWGGSGFIRRYYEYGAAFTQRRLLGLMISQSDNIATRMLRRTHGLEGYRNFIESVGGDPSLLHTISYSHLTANEAGILMREIFRFVETGNHFALELKQDLIRNRYPFIVADYPVASKSGWDTGFGGAFHDMAIVFADSPYVLAVLSTREGAWTDMLDVQSISMFFQNFNYRWFINPSHLCENHTLLF